MLELSFELDIFGFDFDVINGMVLFVTTDEMTGFFLQQKPHVYSFR